jgi:MSHA pilin protein MshA
MQVPIGRIRAVWQGSMMQRSFYWRTFMTNRSAMNGFTLIELVVVIVILGVPRFTAMEVQARIASIQSLAGSIRSSSSLAHAMWMASGSPATVNMDGSNVAITNGYPTRASLPNTLQDTSGFTYTAGTGVFSRNGAPTPANCSVTYTAPAAANTAPTISVPVTAGC